MSPEATGIGFTNRLPEERHLTNQILLNGSGVALGDVDGDSRPDVFFGGLGGGSAVYRNLGGWRFEDVTSATFGSTNVLAGLDVTGCAFADLDGDGRMDLVVNTLGQGTHVFFNDGHGGLAERAPALNPGMGGMSIAIADVDGDGWLDLYICNYRTDALMDRPNARATFRVVGGHARVATLDGRPTSAPDLTNRFVVPPGGGVEELGQASILYRNLGGGRFEAVPWTGGAFVGENGQPLAEPPYDWGLAAMFRDLDGDGRPELYTANDFQSPDRLWLNESTPGRVRFRAAPAFTLRHTSRFSMGVDFADVNRDGRDDFIVLDMAPRDHVVRLSQTEDSGLLRGGEAAVDRPQYSVNTLQLGRPGGGFAEVGAWAGLDASDWSWCPVFLDVDLDGWEDLLVTSGQERAARDADVAAGLEAARRASRLSDAEIFQLRRRFPRFAPPHAAFRNLGGRFVECGASWGWGDAGVAQGMALADLDGDGDLDVVVNQLNGPAAVYRNEAAAARLAVRLRGAAGNRFGIGARLTVRGGAVPTQSQEMIAGGRYLSGDEPVRVFAAGASKALTVEVQWPSGRRTVAADAKANEALWIEESADVPVPPSAPGESRVNPRFESLSLDPGPAEDPFDDFARQPLLPHRLSTLGPGISWVRGTNGADWLAAPGGAGGLLRTFERTTQGWRLAAQSPSIRPQTTLLDLGVGWLVGESNERDATTNGFAVTGPLGVGWRPASTSSPGPLAAADVQGRGGLQVFLGGRSVPGRWPEAADSFLLQSAEPNAAVAQSFPGLGMVSGACFTDLDGDGRPDLVVASEWGAISVFRNTAGRLEPWDPLVRQASLRDAATPPSPGQAVSLHTLIGLWNSVAAGDFDGDGRMDLVVGNWGENFPAARRHPGLVFGDLAGRGGVESIEIDDEPGFPAPVPVRSRSRYDPVLAWARERFPSFQAWGRATVPEIVAGHSTRQVTAALLQSVVLLNRGDCFELHPLPAPAQWSPVFGIAVADFDGDGREDVALVQNFFGLPSGVPRQDAGRGLLLLGDGAGGFTVAEDTGFELYEEGRGLAVADFDGDGRPDLAASRRGAAPLVWRNRAGRPGVRVRLRGPAGNPAAIGASMRWAGGSSGAARREIHAGSGYWSMDSTTVVLPRPAGLDAPASLEVRWPDGAQTTTTLPAGTREVEIGAGGILLSRR